jgi:O-antigen/teichoic acid export membrane protein
MPNLFTQITTLGVTQGEILILGQMASGQEIAAYAGIKRLVQLTGAPLLMINSALPTFIADLVYQKNMGRLESILRGSTTLCCLPLLLASTIFIAFPMWTINLFFDADYSVGVRCLQILSVGNIAAVASGSCGLLLMMSGNQRYAMMSGTIGAIVFVILAPRLTSVFGITGMALGVAVSTIIRSIMSATFAKQRVGIWSVPTFSRTMMRNAIKLVRSEKA